MLVNVYVYVLESPLFLISVESFIRFMCTSSACMSVCMYVLSAFSVCMSCLVYVLYHLCMSVFTSVCLCHVFMSLLLLYFDAVFMRVSLSVFLYICFCMYLCIAFTSKV